MPRRKHAFIDRSRAQTFQLVQTAAPNAAASHVLVPVNAAAMAGAADSGLSEGGIGKLDASSWETSYKRAEYELGEYGFPDDGYDYAQHFRRIGGGGGVFMDAVSGAERPDMVRGSLASVRRGGVVGEGGGGEGGREGDLAGGQDWRRREDIVRVEEAIEEIRRDRKWNKDLDDVFAGLDSDGELESEGGGELREIASGDAGAMELGEEGLEDDFVAFADLTEESGIELDGEKGEQQQVLSGVLEEYRQPRLLDEQFDKFLRAHPLDLSDDDEDVDCLNGESEDGLEDYKEHMTTDELHGLFGESGDLLDDFAKLSVGPEGHEEGERGPQTEIESCDVFESAELKTWGQEEEVEMPAASSRAGWDEQERAAEYEKIAGEEFERGMTGLLDSYNRVTADEAFDALDGLKEAMEAIARTEKEEMEELERKIELGLDDESDGHDSELDSHFDELFRDKDDKWDCETILSTYSNLDNHPSVIDAPASSKPRSVKAQPIIRLDPRTQAPAEFVPSFTENQSRAKTVDFGTRRRVVKDIRARRKKETKEEKKARKNAVKEAARERRALKSEMKKAFASEHIKQNRHATAIGTSKVALQF